MTSVDQVVLARALFGTSLGFHIIFASLGVGIPLMIVIAEITSIITKNRDYHIMAARWTKAFAVLLGVAIPSGTIVGVQLALLWPGFMEIVGQVISLPFQIEIYAFFLEALFMSIYVYAADRLSNTARLISVILVAFGASASAVLITDASAWMNTPAGFRLENGQVVDVDPWAAVFNPSFFTAATHVLLSAYAAGAFAIAAVAAYKLVRNRASKPEKAFHQKALTLALIVGFIASFLTATNGHEAAMKLHEYQPLKLAAAEGLFETMDYAPLAIGGFVDPVTQEVKFGLEIPWMLSWLAEGRFDAEVKGLNDFPREYWPPAYTHTLFNVMVGIGSLLIIISAVGLFRHFFMKKTFPKWMLWLFVACGPLAMIGIETGWIFSCSGRQPWTIYFMQTTDEAATTATGLGIVMIGFVSLYIILGVAVILILLSFFKRRPLLKELSTKEETQ
jgi:cytochrome bd ubiquinol oxidase subunit I